MIKMTRNDEDSTVLECQTCDNHLQVSALYCDGIVSTIGVLVDGNCLQQAKNPITVIRMILMLLEEFESR